MKLVLYTIRELPHQKNWDAIQRMCKSCNIEFEYTNNLKRITENNYDILHCPMNYVEPTIIPHNIKIIYGPQFWVVPKPPMIGDLKHDLIDRCVFNCLSNWVRDYWLELGKSFIMPIEALPFAVDTEKFKPLDKEVEKEYDCIVYIKRRSTNLIYNTISLLNKKGLKYKIFKYGSYNEADYIDCLHKCKFMITLDAHESQGFALEEAMSSNVPLLVIDAKSMYDETNDGINSVYKYLIPNKLLATSVPYWSDECGIKITDESKLSDSLDTMMENYNKFTPREYILRLLSDKVCMTRILEYFKLS